LYTPDLHIIVTDISAFVSLGTKAFYRGVEELLSSACSQQETVCVSSEIAAKSFTTQVHLNGSQEVEIFGFEMGTVGKMVYDLQSAVPKPSQGPVRARSLAFSCKMIITVLTVIFCDELPAVGNFSGTPQYCTAITVSDDQLNRPLWPRGTVSVFFFTDGVTLNFFAGGGSSGCLQVMDACI
jgi:hypothetical protein